MLAKSARTIVVWIFGLLASVCQDRWNKQSWRQEQWQVYAIAAVKRWIQVLQSSLITDVQMSGMSGVDLRDRLVAEGHRTPIIFMTALPTEKLPAVEDGVVGILRKPLSVEQLIYALNRALGAALEPEATSNRVVPDLTQS